jgi:translation initiation factor IF-3
LPPRRGPDTRPPTGPSTRINEAIRAETVRLIDAEGENRGVVPLAEAQEIANVAGLDLVEVAAEARPPVCRIMDYGKWRYEQEQKAKQARRHQSTITIKEIKFRPKIDPHDYVTKKGHVERFLRHRDKVKITIMFRGRELLHPERGEAILLRLADELKDLALVESRPNLDGRNMVMMLAPLKNPVPAAAAGASEGGEAAEASETAPAEATAPEAAAEAPAETTEAEPEPAPESTPAAVGAGRSKDDPAADAGEAEPEPE